MDIVFKCTNCDQEMSVDSSGAGSEIECPSCNESLVIPELSPQTVHVLNPIHASAAAKEVKHFVVPQRSTVEALIQKPRPTLEVAAKDTDKKLRVKTIKHGDCVEVGRDRFDEVVTDFLQKIGEQNVVSITTISYSHTGIGSSQIVSDFGVMIVFKG